MKLNFRLLSVLVLAASAALPVLRAQDAPAAPPPPAEHAARPSPAKMRAHRLKMLDEKLQLTADQKAKINAIWDKADPQVKALRDDDTLSREDRRAKADEIMKSTHAEVRAVLTADQQKIFDAMPPEGRGRRPHADDDKPADAPPAPQS